MVIGEARKTLISLVIMLLATTTPSLLMAAESHAGISKRLYEQIEKVQELADAEAYSQALDKLKKLKSRKRNNYERAVILQMSGFLYYQLDNLPKALTTYQEALTQPELPDSMQRNLLTTISQLYLIERKYIAAEKYARKLLASPGKKTPPASSVILSQALFGQERYSEALEPLLDALNLQRKTGVKVRENWLAMLSSIYFSMDNFHAMREVLYELVSLYPKEQYFMNLAAIHGQLDDTQKQLVLMESLKDDQRLVSEHHLVNLANLFMLHELPFKAASLLERETAKGRIKKNKRNLKLQSQAWYLAAEYEKSLSPLKTAAKLSKDGELWLRIARIYVSLYDWKNAEQAAQNAIAENNLKEPGSALILQGMALTEQKKYEQAKKIFRRASKYETSKKWAQQWLAFVNNEEKRLAALQ